MIPISILVGGRSTEHDASILSYLGVIEDYQENRPQGWSIETVYYIGIEGNVYKHKIVGDLDFPCDEQSLRTRQAMPRTDLIGDLVASQSFIFSLLHGNEGEDGAFQGVAEIFDIPGNFGSVYASCIGMHKWTQALVASAVLPSQLKKVDTLLLPTNVTEETLKYAVSYFAGRPCIIKPNSMGASLLTQAIDCLSRELLQKCLMSIGPYDAHALLQERIYGKEYTCGCLETPDGVIALPVIEARTNEGFLGHAEKHSTGGVSAIVYRKPTILTTTIQQASVELFKWMQYADMCRFDYMVDSGGSIYFLEANTLPGLMKGSAYPKMLQAANYTLTDLLTLSIENFKARKVRSKVLRYHIAH